MGEVLNGRPAGGGHAGLWLGGIVAALLAFAVVVAHRVRSDPDVVLLTPRDGAEWVRADRPFYLGLNVDRTVVATFETTFTVPASAGGEQVLHVSALGQLAVSVDGRAVADTGWGTGDWRTARAVRLPAMSAGQAHRLRVVAEDRSGPSLICADCRPLDLRTGSGRWRATERAEATPSDRWPAAVSADHPWDLPLTDRFKTAGQSVAVWWPSIAAAAAVGAGASLWTRRRPDVDWGRAVRLAVLVAWVGMGRWNLFRVPMAVGYDLGGHLDYVRSVAATWRVPLPTEGFETFHPPLFYFAAAALYRLATACGGAPATAATVLRLIPLACGAAMVELCYRAARATFPGRGDLHAVSAVVGGLVPMNLYMAQAVSNEPAAACLGGAVTVVCLWMLAGRGRRPAGWALLGLLLGLAILTKLSGLVWVGPAAGVVAVTARRGWPRVIAPAAMLAVAAAVCGGYFVRNERAIGVPFLTHSIVGTSRWWQDPGYRTPAQFATFGRALVRPVFPAPASIWDDLYSTVWSDGMLNGLGAYAARPPWNYGLMSCGLWLALGPTAAILAGVGVAVAGRSATAAPLRFAAATMGAFGLALLYVCLTWPVYSCVKASYLLGVTPCGAVLAAAGFDRVRGRWPRAIAVGWLTAWAVASWLTYLAAV